MPDVGRKSKTIWGRKDTTYGRPIQNAKNADFLPNKPSLPVIFYPRHFQFFSLLSISLPACQRTFLPVSALHPRLFAYVPTTTSPGLLDYSLILFYPNMWQKAYQSNSNDVFVCVNMALSQRKIKNLNLRNC